MGRYNNGVIYTNDKCSGCNKCISDCPVLGANVTTIRKDKHRVDVSKKCVDCGACVKSCSHGARQYKDDTEIFFANLASGSEISLLVDPAFYIDYGEKAYKVLGYLKKKGVKLIYDVNYGAEISMYLHAKYLKEHTDENGVCDKMIANICPALTNYAEDNMPELLSLIIPVQTPPVCTAIYVRKYLNDSAKLAYINPCVAQAEELSSFNTGRYIGYSVTFSHLMNYVENEDIEDCYAKPDLQSSGLGNLLAISGGFKEGVARFFNPGTFMIHYDGIDENTYKALAMYSQKNVEGHPYLITTNLCRGGCIYGTGTEIRELQDNSVLERMCNARHDAYCGMNSEVSATEFYETMSKFFEELKAEDFYREFEDKYRQPFIVPESTIQLIFEKMHKDTEEKQNLNCHSCGYQTCHDMAEAIANGYAKMQNCNHFMNDDLRIRHYIDVQYGIYNSNGFFKYAAEMLHHNPTKRYIMAIMNVSKLRNVNELYGKSMGDEVMYFLSGLIKEFVTDIGMFGRLGGSVFAMIFEETPENLDRLLSRKYYDCTHLGIDYPITARFGLISVDRNSKSLSTYADMATYAMGTAYDLRYNSYIFFSEDMYGVIENEISVTRQMHKALEKNEFVLYFQPQYDHVSSKMVGAEVLARWVRPDGSIISPGMFIPVFEKNGFVRELDKFIWKNAFRMIQEWEKNNLLQVPISLNISRLSLADDKIIAYMKKLEQEYPIDKKHVHFEITESAYIANQKDMVKRITKLRELGYEIAMDDFGSGYSSLNSLKDIPIDILKLDMGFLEGKNNQKKGNSIIEYIIQMAKAINMKTVAEGVETIEQADLITDYGCDVIQGYYYARPMPEREFEELLKEK